MRHRIVRASRRRWRGRRGRGCRRGCCGGGIGRHPSPIGRGRSCGTPRSRRCRRDCTTRPDHAPAALGELERWPGALGVMAPGCMHKNGVRLQKTTGWITSDSESRTDKDDERASWSVSPASCCGACRHSSRAFCAPCTTAATLSWSVLCTSSATARGARRVRAPLGRGFGAGGGKRLGECTA